MTTDNTPATLATAKHGGCVQLGTPRSRWAASGEPDPHGTRYDCERAALVMGDLTDDELANAVFMHGNERQTMADLVGGATPAVGYLTAAKDRIRWISRALAAAESLSAQPSPGGQGDALELLEAYDQAVEDLSAERSDGWNEDNRRPQLEANVADLRAELVAALAARQPVGQITNTEIDARLNDLYREITRSGQHNGGMSGVAWDRAVYRMASNQPSGKSGELAIDTQPMGCTECPVTGLPFYGNMEHPKLGWIAMYGGPLDVYSVPELQDNDGELRRERYDLDADCWVEGGEPLGYFYSEQQPEDAPTAQAVDLEQQQDAARWRAIAPHLSVEWDEDEMLKRWTWIDFKGDALSVPTRSRESYASVEEAIDAVINSQAVGNG